MIYSLQQNKHLNTELPFLAIENWLSSKVSDMTFKGIKSV